MICMYQIDWTVHAVVCFFTHEFVHKLSQAITGNKGKFILKINVFVATVVEKIIKLKIICTRNMFKTSKICRPRRL